MSVNETGLNCDSYLSVGRAGNETRRQPPRRTEFPLISFHPARSQSVPGNTAGCKPTHSCCSAVKRGRKSADRAAVARRCTAPPPGEWLSPARQHCAAGMFTPACIILPTTSVCVALTFPGLRTQCDRPTSCKSLVRVARVEGSHHTHDDKLLVTPVAAICVPSCWRVVLATDK